MEFLEMSEDKLSGGCKKRTDNLRNNHPDDSYLFLKVLAIIELSKQRRQRNQGTDETLFTNEYCLYEIKEPVAMKYIICKSHLLRQVIET